MSTVAEPTQTSALKAAIKSANDLKTQYPRNGGERIELRLHGDRNATDRAFAELKDVLSESIAAPVIRRNPQLDPQQLADTMRQRLDGHIKEPVLEEGCAIVNMPATPEIKSVLQEIMDHSVGFRASPKNKKPFNNRQAIINKRAVISTLESITDTDDADNYGKIEIRFKGRDDQIQLAVAAIEAKMREAAPLNSHIDVEKRLPKIFQHSQGPEPKFILCPKGDEQVLEYLPEPSAPINAIQRCMREALDDVLWPVVGKPHNYNYLNSMQRIPKPHAARAVGSRDALGL